MTAGLIPAISVEALTKQYGGRVVVDGLSFQVAAGETLALLGPNGAGKTTTVEILEGYRTADGGKVRVLGLDPAREGRALRARVGLMLQEGGVYPQIRPLEALRLFASFYADSEDPLALLHLVGLEDSARTRYRQLSGGQKQRLSLALALVGKPELVFLDEPTAAMDPQARRATWRLIRDLKRRGVTVMLTTHSMEEAEQLADRVAIIDRGKLAAMGTIEQLARQSAAAVIRFTAPKELDTAALLSQLARFAARAVREEEAGLYVVDAEPSPALLAALAAWLEARGALMTGLSVARHSLEEVFLQLTGSADR